MKTIVFLVFLLLSAFRARAADTDACLDQVVRVGLYDLSFAMMRSESGQASGAAVDVLKELGSRTGCRVTFFYAPQARIKSMFLQDQLDIIPATRNPEYDAKGIFIQQFSAQPVVLSLDPHYKHAQPDLIFTSSLRFLAVRGSDSARAIIDHSKARGYDIQVEYSPTPELAVKKLLARRGDFLIGSTLLYYRALRQQMPDIHVEVIKIDTAPIAAGYYINRSLQTKVGYVRVYSTLLAMQADGTMAALSKDYLPPSVAQAVEVDAPAPSKKRHRSKR